MPLLSCSHEEPCSSVNKLSSTHIHLEGTFEELKSQYGNYKSQQSPVWEDIYAGHFLGYNGNTKCLSQSVLKLMCYGASPAPSWLHYSVKLFHAQPLSCTYKQRSFTPLLPMTLAGCVFILQFLQCLAYLSGRSEDRILWKATGALPMRSHKQKMSLSMLTTSERDLAISELSIWNEVNFNF